MDVSKRYWYNGKCKGLPYGKWLEVVNQEKNTDEILAELVKFNVPVKYIEMERIFSRSHLNLKSFTKIMSQKLAIFYHLYQNELSGLIYQQQMHRLHIWIDGCL